MCESALTVPNTRRISPPRARCDCWRRFARPASNRAFTRLPRARCTAMWRMLQQDQPDDYVIATNEAHSVREFLEIAFGHAGLNWKQHVEIDPRYFRPAEVDLLIGDYSKARRALSWEPKTRFADLVKLM